MAQAIIDALEDSPISWVKTITSDNGTEFARHEDIAKETPRCTWSLNPGWLSEESIDYGR